VTHLDAHVDPERSAPSTSLEPCANATNPSGAITEGVRGVSALFEQLDELLPVDGSIALLHLLGGHPPGAGVHGMCGCQAAGWALRHLGVEAQGNGFSR
jgi:hypothetical protein